MSRKRYRDGWVLVAVAIQISVLIFCILFIGNNREQVGYNRGYAKGLLACTEAMESARFRHALQQMIQRARDDHERWLIGYKDGTVGVGCWGEGLYPSPERTYTLRALSRFSTEEQHATE